MGLAPGCEIVDVGEGIRTVSEVPMWEQMALAAFMQRYWADNQVSCTVTFDPETEGKQIANALDYFQYQLKGISFLPKMELGAYRQMPYEEITEKKYNEIVSSDEDPLYVLSKYLEMDELIEISRAVVKELERELI